MAENLPKNLEIVATVTHSRHCANFISENETFVFDVNGCLLPEKSSANLCLGILARIQPALLNIQDRINEGIEPLPSSLKFLDCFFLNFNEGLSSDFFRRLVLKFPNAVFLRKFGHRGSTFREDAHFKSAHVEQQIRIFTGVN